MLSQLCVIGFDQVCSSMMLTSPHDDPIKPVRSQVASAPWEQGYLHVRLCGSDCRHCRLRALDCAIGDVLAAEVLC